MMSFQTFNRYKNEDTLNLTAREFSVSSEVCAMMRIVAAVPAEIRQVT